MKPQMTLDEFSSIIHCDRTARWTHARPRRTVVGREGQLDASARICSAGRRRRGLVGARLLHRKEGDQGNAAYWYGRAGKPVCRESLDAEWLNIATQLLK